jgi:hypothetical protein
VGAEQPGRSDRDDANTTGTTHNICANDVDDSGNDGNDDGNDANVISDDTIGDCVANNVAAATIGHDDVDGRARFDHVNSRRDIRPQPDTLLLLLLLLA